ncbi:uncharacterized protein LOC118015071 [Mirounga leonina]|uniref:uncharacterized protein LOC118015071 n=1 Tax=Mirounga leonina TaxID=9715 RepID=UPI00156C0216|nr:uncharacterized protein LOC118015071 [Mirounga leonina]
MLSFARARSARLVVARPGPSWRVAPATGWFRGQRPVRPLRGQVSCPLCPSARSTSPRAGGAVEQVSPPRTVGVAGAAPDAVVDAGLEDPGFWHSARHLLLVSLCSHRSPVRLAAPRESKAGVLLRVSAPSRVEMSSARVAALPPLRSYSWKRPHSSSGAASPST